MVKNSPENDSQNCCGDQENKEVETDVPDAFLQPERPQSEAHKHEDDYDDKCKIECLGALSGLVNNHV